MKRVEVICEQTGIENFLQPFFGYASTCKDVVLSLGFLLRDKVELLQTTSLSSFTIPAVVHYY